MKSYTYVIENTATKNSLAAYVGKANNPQLRFEEHLKEIYDTSRRYLRSHFTNAIRKYGQANFVLHVVEECDSEEEAFEQERSWIEYLKSMGVHLYNKSPGGYGGQKRSALESTRAKMSATHKIRQQSQELRKRTSDKLKGHIKSAETCQKLSVSKSKRVDQLNEQGEFIASFASALDAENATGACRSKICMCCKGLRPRAGGFRWRYGKNDCDR